MGFPVFKLSCICYYKRFVGFFAINLSQNSPQKLSAFGDWYVLWCFIKSD
ncbi:hypothetical protein [Moraxella lacunata]